MRLPAATKVKPVDINILTAIHTAITGIIICNSPIQSFASPESFNTYNNQRYNTKISYPKNWEQKQGSLSNDRTVVAFTDPEDQDTSISLTFNPIPADYTRLTSFGGKDSLRLYLLPRGEGVVTNLIEETIKGENYYLEYIVSAPNAPTRHIESIFALRPQELVVGVIAQTKEESFSKHKEEFDTVIPSFELDLN